MANEYLDIEKKLQYHKKQVLLDLVKQGVYPSDKTIQQRIENIDMNLALFKSYNVVSGKCFDTNDYNERLKLIYEDLKFLYEILYELTVRRYYKLQTFINSHVRELDSIVQTYERRANYENNTTTLGNTLLFKNNNLLIENNNSITTVDLGSIEIENAATIACIANINNINPENVIFKIRKGENGAWNIVNAYNYNNDLFITPGEKKTNKYDYNAQEGQVITTPFLMDIGVANVKNKYTILGGENKIFVNYKDDNGFIIEENPITLDSLSFNKKAYINFFVVGGSSITFGFNKKPIAANFPVDMLRVDNLDDVHHFYMECDENFSFNFEIDKGKVYAIKEQGAITNNKLYYTGSNTINDFHVIETTAEEKYAYDIKLEIYNTNEDIDVDSIIIKQIE